MRAAFDDDLRAADERLRDASEKLDARRLDRDFAMDLVAAAAAAGDPGAEAEARETLRVVCNDVARYEAERDAAFDARAAIMWRASDVPVPRPRVICHAHRFLGMTEHDLDEARERVERRQECLDEAMWFLSCIDPASKVARAAFSAAVDYEIAKLDAARADRDATFDRLAALRAQTFEDGDPEAPPAAEGVGRVGG